MTADDIISEIEKVCRSDWVTELTPLLERLRREDSTEMFHVLFPLAAHSQDCGPAAPAALLLRGLNPKCPISCRDAIREMLFDWEVSNKEVPFYLAEQFGPATVLATVMELRIANTDRNQLCLLATIDYWLGCYKEILEYRKQNDNHP